MDKKVYERPLPMKPPTNWGKILFAIIIGLLLAATFGVILYEICN